MHPKLQDSLDAFQLSVKHIFYIYELYYNGKLSRNIWPADNVSVPLNTIPLTILESLACVDHNIIMSSFMYRFAIEQKLRKAKKKEKEKAKRTALDPSSVAPKSAASTSQRSQDRRKNMEETRQQKDSKKFSALKDLKARREEKKRQCEINTGAGVRYIYIWLWK